MSSVTRTPLEPRRKDGKIYSHARKIWLVETPEEKVRQEYLCTLVNEYGYQVEQIAEELIVTGRGSGNARADFVIWRTTTDREANKLPLVVVECKADNVTIDQKTYEQGAHYAQYVRAPFFVTHNNRETKFWKVDLERLAPNFAEIENIPHADASDKQIDELVKKLKVFKEDEFADLLHKCHNVIRNRDHLDPAAAFDEIAKILFVKVWVEREMKKKRQRQNLFTVEFLESQLGDNPLNSLFNETKQHYATDKIFKEDERINLKPNTGSEIVKLLERYNLSDTSEDVKGIAFERFLGRTFRGEIGQFFTPRSIVEFMIRIVAPAEGDVICDPASGSGGFLIRFFEIVREQVLADIDRRYNAYREEMESRADLSLEERAKLLRAEFEKLQKEIDQTRKTARLWTLANRCIYGTDANERMARTSKMNMIMHGDGHGGVHHHNGFLNVNGIFEQRFDIVLTNPPFGSNVEESDKVLEAQARVSDEVYERYLKDYGEAYREAQERVSAAFDNKQSIAELFTLPKRAQSKVKTEILFIERCLALLKPGGRLGIVLPEGVFNNPSLQYVREFCEDRAFIRAVVSLPQGVFKSAKADVKTSLLFVQKFTESEGEKFVLEKQRALEETQENHKVGLERLAAVIDEPNAKAADFLTEQENPPPEQRRAAAEAAKRKNEKLRERRAVAKRERSALQEEIRCEARALLKERLDYPVFMYEATRVGVTTTGEDDLNELYPNAKQPPGVKETCLELYQQFCRDPAPFFAQGFRD